MINGTVNAKCQPIVSLAIRNDTGLEVTVDARMDTGYNEALMLPLEQVESLGSRLIRTDTATVAAGSQPLLGMSLTLSHKITVEMVDGGAVTIERL